MKTNLLLAACAFIVLSCQKEVSGELDGTNGTVGSAYPYYFIATINAGNVKFEADDLSSRYGCGTSQPYNAIGSDYDIYEGTVLMDPAEPTKNTIYVHILKYFDHDPNQAEKNSMIKIGNYGFGYSDMSSSTINGASIDYNDAAGNTWFSETGPQTGSTFAITELIANTDGTSGKLFKANFSCKLYSPDGSKSILVTNAVIRGKILSP